MSEYIPLLKQPSEVMTRSIDFSGRLADGVTLSSATATVIDMLDNSDVSASLLASTTGTVSSPNASFTFQNGVDGRKYKVSVLGTLDNSDVTEVDLLLTVRDL